MKTKKLKVVDRREAYAARKRAAGEFVHLSCNLKAAPDVAMWRDLESAFPGESNQAIVRLALRTLLDAQKASEKGAEAR